MDRSGCQQLRLPDTGINSLAVDNSILQTSTDKFPVSCLKAPEKGNLPNLETCSDFCGLDLGKSVTKSDTLLGLIPHTL